MATSTEKRATSDQEKLLSVLAQVVYLLCERECGVFVYLALFMCDQTILNPDLSRFAASSMSVTVALGIGSLGASCPCNTMGLVYGTPCIKRYPAPRGQKKMQTILSFSPSFLLFLKRERLRLCKIFSPWQYSARTFFETFRMSSLQGQPLHQVHPSADRAKCSEAHPASSPS